VALVTLMAISLEAFECFQSWQNFSCVAVGRRFPMGSSMAGVPCHFQCKKLMCREILAGKTSTSSSLGMGTRPADANSHGEGTPVARGAIMVPKNKCFCYVKSHTKPVLGSLSDVQPKSKGGK